MNVDLTALYFGDDLKITDDIWIRQPTVREVVDYGEMNFWQMITTFCANTTAMRLPLWNEGIDWNKISDFELFCMLRSSYDPKFLSLIFTEEIHFERMIVIPVKENAEDENEEPKPVLVDPENPSVFIDETIYKDMVENLRAIFNYHPIEEFARNRFDKEFLIEDDELQIFNRKRMQRIKPKKESWLLPYISVLLNHPGFKYNKEQLRNVKFFEFMDSVHRICQIERTTSLMTGMYFGMVDFKENKHLREDLDFYKQLY